MAEPTIKRVPASLVIDLQGPFALKATAYDRFATVQIWPDVSIFITSEQEADDIIAVVKRAKAMLPKKAADDA